MTLPALARLEAESAIRRLVGLYCDAVNRRDADAAGLLFAEDAEIRIADFPSIAGRQAIREGMRQTFAVHTFLRQQCDAGVIDVDDDGDSARARLSVIEATQREGEERLSLIFGFYEDDYVRLAKGWRFRRRRYTLQFRCRLDIAGQQLPGNPDFGFGFLPDAGTGGLDLPVSPGRSATANDAPAPVWAASREEAEMDAQSQQLSDMLAREAIRNCIARLARGEDRRDAALISSAYWRDAHIDFGIFEGDFETYLGFVVPGDPSLPCTLHFLGQTHTELAGDSARAETLVMSYHRIDSGEGHKDMTIGGRYLDTFARRAGEWRIARRVMLYDFVQNAGESADWSQGVMGMPFSAEHFSGRANGDFSEVFFGQS